MPATSSCIKRHLIHLSLFPFISSPWRISPGLRRCLAKDTKRVLTAAAIHQTSSNPLCIADATAIRALRMTRVLILTSGYGEGHNAAARALAAGLADLGGEAEVRDLFLEAYGEKQNTSRRLYLDCIERAPLLWLIVYKLLDRLPIMRFAIAPSLFSMQALLARVLAERKPQHVVCVYPGYNYVLDRIRRGHPLPHTRHTLVTDSITVNTVWHRGGSDTWLVANEDTAAVMRDAHVPAEKIHITGFPVPLVFADSRPQRPPPGRGEPLRILFNTNSAAHHAPELVAHLLDIPGIHLTVTVGRDEKLRRAIERIAAGRPVEIHGWTPLMPRLLMTRHLLIGKAGGAATQEAIAAQTPFLITKIVPGQEEGNALLISANGCGAIATSPSAIIGQVEDLLANDHALWHRWHAAIQRISRPDSARTTARFILGCAEKSGHS